METQPHPLRAWLEARGETAKDFCRRAQISESSLSRIMAGLQRPSHGAICSIVTATGGEIEPKHFFPPLAPAPASEAA